MRLTTRTFVLAACLCLASSCQANSGRLSEAWFVSTTSLGATPSVPVTWCSFVTQVDAEGAVDSGRFGPVESGWLRYRDNAIDSLVIFSQSEDAYLEDTYTFGPDLAVEEVVRKGHYFDDPFVTATFRPDDSGHLSMTAASRQALRSWEHTTYFFEWQLYAAFSEIPFAGLIGRTPSITVSEACLETRG